MTDESNSLNKNSQTGTQCQAEIRLQHHGNVNPALFQFCFLPLFPSECCCVFSFTSLHPHASLRRCHLKSPDSWVAAKWMFLLSPPERLFSISILKHFVQSVDFMAIKNKATKIKSTALCVFFCLRWD